MTTTAGIHHHPHHHLHLDWESALDALATACVVGALLFALALATGMFPERWSDPSTVHVSTRAPIRFPAPPAIPTATAARTAAAPPTTSVTRPVAVAPPPVTAAPAPAPPFTTSCRDALAYLAANHAPGYVDTCAPGSALGHYGYTCANVPGRCSGVRIVHIACPAPFVYRNEAHNSWMVIGLRSGIDPYGQGTPSEQAACNRFR